MILYLASYPRSGNSLLQSILERYFQLPSSTVYYRQPTSYLRYPSRKPLWENWREYRPESSKRSPRDRFYTKWLMLYDQKPPLQKHGRLFIKRGCKNALSPLTRRWLADEQDWFVIKTHERPFNLYFKGEFILQPLRHPGAVLRSYIRLIRSRGGIHKLRSLRQIIRGWTKQGSYANYHQDWMSTIKKNPGQGLRVKYENILANITDELKRISTFLSLEYDHGATLSDFKDLQSGNPKMYGFGSNEDWESSFSGREKILFWKRNRDVMLEMGYLAIGDQG